MYHELLLPSCALSVGQVSGHCECGDLNHRCSYIFCAFSSWLSYLFILCVCRLPWDILSSVLFLYLRWELITSGPRMVSRRGHSPVAQAPFHSPLHVKCARSFCDMTSLLEVLHTHLHHQGLLLCFSSQQTSLACLSHPTESPQSLPQTPSPTW